MHEGFLPLLFSYRRESGKNPENEVSGPMGRKILRILAAPRPPKNTPLFDPPDPPLPGGGPSPRKKRSALCRVGQTLKLATFPGPPQNGPENGPFLGPFFAFFSDFFLFF